MKKAGHLLKLIEDLENKYINLEELKKYLEDKNIHVVNINIYYGGASIDLCLENNRHVQISAHTFSNGTYTLDICNCSSGLHTVVEEVDNSDFVKAVVANICKQTLDYKEPEKERLELQTNFENGVSVSCEDAATNFVNLKFIPLIDDKEVRDNLKKLLKLCRDNKISVKGRSKIEPKLSKYSEYVKDVETYNNGVKELQEIWKNIVEEGIYSGYGDDERIDNAHQKRFALERLLHGNSAMSVYKSIAKDIQDKLDKIEYQVNNSEVRTLSIGF